MKNTSNLIASEKKAAHLFTSWNAVVHFLEQFSWKPVDGNTLHICGMKSGEWQVEVKNRENNTQLKKNVKSTYGIGLHDLSW